MHHKALANAKGGFQVEKICIGIDNEHLKAKQLVAKRSVEHVDYTVSRECTVRDRTNEKREARETKKKHNKVSKKARKKVTK